MLQALRISGHRALELVHSIPEEKADYRYAEGKWSTRELLCHMIDAERIFASLSFYLLFGVLFGRLLFDEPHFKARFIGAVLITAGVVAVYLL